MRPRATLAVLFVFSGMAGLIYESIWSRYLGLFVGHGAYAQVIVLVIYLGGMSLGAFFAARRSERLRDPLLGYAAAEAATGAIGLAFHPLFVAVTQSAYDALFPALGAGVPLLALKWSLAGAMILPQSILLGTTFPLMTAAALRRTPGNYGRTIAWFYFANSLGAAIGALVSGFFLVGAVGLPGTVMTAALLNLGVAAAAAAMARGSGSGAAATSSGAGARPRRGVPREEPATTAASGHAGVSRLLLIVAFGTAVSSFFYEIGWVRMLSLVLGGATRAFEIMLSAFILGLAVGALWMSTRADRFRAPLEALGILQCAMGAMALATLPLYLLSFHWMAGAVTTLPHDDGGYRLFNLLRYGISLGVMLPATVCAGTTLPLLTRSLMAAGQGERAIGTVYGVNTLGSIVGTAAAGLLLLPLIGLKGLLIAGALLDIGLGIWTLRFAARPSKRVSSTLRLAVAGAASMVVVALLTRLDPLVVTSGVYRSGTLAKPGDAHVTFYRDGRTATVCVARYDTPPTMYLSTNGKADASLRTLWLEPPAERPRTTFYLDESTQVLLAIVPLAFAPRAAEAAVIGQGSGMTSHYLLGSPFLRHLTTIEIEPEMIQASRSMWPANRRVFEDPRSHFAIDDARSFFAARRQPFDLIVSEPSNPWVSGVAGLFSIEFYAHIVRQLSPHGVFAQWLHIYELNDDLALSVIAALHRNFRDYQIFLVDEGDMVVVATNRSEGLVADWSVAQWPAIAADLANLPSFTPGLFEALRIGDRAVFEPLIRAGPKPNSDYHPVLDIGAERARFLHATARGFLVLHDDRLSFSLLSGGHRVPPIPDFRVPAPAIWRQRDLSMSAALRRPPVGLSPEEIDGRLPAALQRKAQMQVMFASGRPPSDWRAWVFEAASAEYDWHCGTAGVVDEGFYGLLRGYLARCHAPPEAVAAIAFLHDAAAWRMPEAAREADPLLALAARGQDWLPASLLLDGAVAAKLLTGDRAGARRAFEILRPRARRDLSDLRSRLVLAHLEAPGSQ